MEASAGYSPQLVDTLPNLTEMEVFLIHIFNSYVFLRNLKYPYYNWKSITDKWAEYDRVYEVRAKSDRNDYEYRGFSNIVFPDFHANIETLKTKEMNTLFNGADQFEVHPVKDSTTEDAILAKKLVKHNFDMVASYENEVRKIIHDRQLYGTYFAYIPYVEEIISERIEVDYMTNPVTGDPILDAFGNPQQTMPHMIEVTKASKKYTDLRHINLKRVYLHPRVENIQDQEAIFINIKKSYSELLQMEQEGIIGPGKAEYIKTFFTEFNDPDLDRAEDEQFVGGYSNMQVAERNARVYNLYLTFFWYGDTLQERKMYQCIWIRGISIVGINEIPEKKHPFIMGNYIKTPGSCYGVGVGDEQYPVYIAKCARYNQVYDLSTLEIKGGGFKDATALPDFNGMVPGEFKDVVGLTQMRSTGGSPVLTWQEIRGAAPSRTGLEPIASLDEAMQNGTGAFNVMKGTATDTDIDKTAKGIELTMNAGNERVNSYLADFEEDFFKEYATRIYDNYQEFLTPDDISSYFEEDELKYIDEKTGKEQPINIRESLADVDFEFLAAKKASEAEVTIGKIMRLIQIYMTIGQADQGFAQLIQGNIDRFYLIKKITESVGVIEFEKLFPKFNPTAQLLQATQQLQQESQTNQGLMMGLDMLKQRLTEQGNRSALIILDQIESMLTGKAPQVPPQLPATGGQDGTGQGGQPTGMATTQQAQPQPLPAAA
jgi:hypothetical protein